jgi:hypothetical protein
MKRTFALGPAMAGKLVVIEVNGTHLTLLQKQPDGAAKRREKDYKSEADARAECERLVKDLTSHGYTEQSASRSGASKPVPSGRKSTPAADPDEIAVRPLLDDDAPSRGAEPVLPRLATVPGAARAASDTPKKKAGGKKKKKKKAGNPDALDKRVLAAVAAVGLGFAGLVGYFVYDAFLKPATIVGKWQGSMVEFETGGPMSYAKYALLLDEKKNASLTLQEKITSNGTYSLKGNRLMLMLKDEDGAEVDKEYKVSLGRATLDLMDPSRGKLIVQLIRFREAPVIAKAAPKINAPNASGVAEGDATNDAALASVEFAPKDNAFKLHFPKGWQSDTGSRPDNTYSWASFTDGSATIKVVADIQGSLMSGSDSAGQHEEGSELAPVHTAHALYEKVASDEFSDYKESKPTLFKGSKLGEGRVSLFTASGGGLFGSKLRGYRVTLLTNDRRVSVLCSCSEKEFAKVKPTFLAVCRSVAR